MTTEKFADLTVQIWRKRQELDALIAALAANQITQQEFDAAYRPAHKRLFDAARELVMPVPDPDPVETLLNTRPVSRAFAGPALLP